MCLSVTMFPCFTSSSSLLHLTEKYHSTYFSRYANPMNTLRSWTKEGSASSSVTLLLLRMTPGENTNKERKFSRLPVWCWWLCFYVCMCVCVSACTQWCIEADTHQVKPVVFHIFGSVECVLAPLKRFVRRLCDQPVVRLGLGGVNNGGVALQVQKHLEQCRCGQKKRWKDN